MTVKEIKEKAKNVGLNPSSKMKKTELIRAIQEKEGNSPCFQTAPPSCDQMNCCWRSDCLA